MSDLIITPVHKDVTNQNTNGATSNANGTLNGTIPDELKQRNQWVLWKYVGGSNKIPCDVRGYRIDAHDPKNWLSFADAVKDSKIAGMAGIGFDFTENDPYGGIDLDDCIDSNGSISSWAQDIIQRFNSYTEISPSGKGVKIFVRVGQLFDAHADKSLEMYTHKRFFTVTGRHLPGTPYTIEDRTEEFCRLLESARAHKKLNPLVAKYVEKARNGEGRNNSGFGLACQLRDNNVVKEDATRVMEIYQRTVDDPTDPYTLDEALRTLDSAYNSSKREPAGRERLDDFAYTELGNAHRLVHRHGDNIKYAEGLGWLVWESDRWAEDDSKVRNRMQGIVEEMLHRAVDIKNEESRKAAVAWALKSQSAHHINAAVSLAADMFKVRTDATKFDNAGQWLLNVANGTIDLRTGLLREHKREDYLTYMIDVTYDPEAKCPTWLAFLDRIMAGRADLIGFLKRAVGYTLTPDASEQCLFFLYGTGKNGKSTFTETITKLLGVYAYRVKSEFLMALQGGSNPEAPSPVMAELRGKRLVVTSELEEGQRWSEAKVKDLTGGDTITARTPYSKKPVQFRPSHKLWIYGNYRPTVRGTDDGIRRRMKLIPFTVKIPGDEQDPTLPEKLAAELPGILNWALEGLKEWRELHNQGKKLPTPDIVHSATQEYLDDMDIVQQFIDEMCSVGPKYESEFKHLYKAYESWCQARGEMPFKSRRFAEALTHKEFVNVKRGGDVYRRGIKLWGEDEERPGEE